MVVADAVIVVGVDVVERPVFAAASDDVAEKVVAAAAAREQAEGWVLALAYLSRLCRRTTCSDHQPQSSPKSSALELIR